LYGRDQREQYERTKQRKRRDFTGLGGNYHSSASHKLQPS
jgi:hypothetical protein